MTRFAVLAALALMFVLSGCSLGGDDGGSSDSSRTTTRVEVVEGLGSEGGFDARKIYKAEAPGVVTIVSLFGDAGNSGEGSGFVLNGEGEIVTNAHVVTTGEGEAIRRAREVYVEFADGNRVEARVLGHDPNADVALLRVDPEGLSLRPLPLGNSAKVEVGEPVAAIGSPFGQAQSLSVGIVSAVDRNVASLTEFRISGAIQTDAAINPGNSGGPLVGADGRVIGINQQIQSRSGGGEGVGFAVPIDVVKRSVAQLREHGTARYAYLGVTSTPLYPQLVEHFDLDVEKGAWIQSVNPGGPAEKAGLRGGSGEEIFQGSAYRRGGDIITKLGEQPVADADDLANAILRFEPGDTVTVEIHRDGETRQVKVKLGERPLGDPTGG
ncbi:MAG TPA: trypsin-like peptidase domain-containing protein [Solirubrobacter sp.]|nr:trypsin-like peptidase domain-containing protein [Solirubrobacter sp.]